MDCQTANSNNSDLDLSEQDLDVVEFEIDSKSLTPTDSIQNLHHEHHLNHHSPLHCRQHYTSSVHGLSSTTGGDRTLSSLKSSSSASYQHNHSANNGKSFYLSTVSSSPCGEDSYLKQLSTLRQEERNLLKEIQLLESTQIEEDDEELIEFQRIEKEIKLAEINKCLTMIRTQIAKQEAETLHMTSESSLERQNLRAPLAESEGDTDSQVSSRNNESPAVTSPNIPTTFTSTFSPQRFVYLSDSSSSDDSTTEDDDKNHTYRMEDIARNNNQDYSKSDDNNHNGHISSPSMVHETMLHERIERSLASIGRQSDELNNSFRCITLGDETKITCGEKKTTTNVALNTDSTPLKSYRRGSEYENQDYHQCHSTHQQSLELLDARESRLGRRFLERDFGEENQDKSDRYLGEDQEEEEIEVRDESDMLFDDNSRRFPSSSTNGGDKSNVILRTQQQQTASSSSLASNAQRPLTLYLPSANSQLNLITHLHALGHDLTNSVVTNNLLITPFTCSGYLYKQCTRSQVGRKKWRKRYFHFNRIRNIFVYFDDRAAFEKHQHPKRGVFFDEIQDVYVDHTKSKICSTPSKCQDETQQSHSTSGRSVFVVSTTEIDRKFTLSTFVPELMRIWMDVIFTGANGYLQDYEDYEN